MMQQIAVRFAHHYICSLTEDHLINNADQTTCHCIPYINFNLIIGAYCHRDLLLRAVCDSVSAGYDQVFLIWLKHKLVVNCLLIGEVLDILNG